MVDNHNPTFDISQAFTDAAEKAGVYTVLVNTRHRIPATGVVYANDLVLTADHVVERDEDLSILLADGEEIPVTLAGRDPGSDLALLRLSQPSPALVKPPTGEARLGQLVLALGRPSSQGLEASMGVISALGGPARTGRGGLLQRYIRTDAIFYPGFSGGPLVNTQGDVLGINTSGLGHGASITIPIAHAWQTAETLAQYGHIRRGYLGIRSQPVAISPAQQGALGREQETGLLLVAVESGSPAENGGLLVGDILVGIAGQPINHPDDLFVNLSGSAIGQPITIEVLRAGQPVSLSVTVGEHYEKEDHPSKRQHCC